MKKYKKYGYIGNNKYHCENCYSKISYMPFIFKLGIVLFVLLIVGIIIETNYDIICTTIINWQNLYMGFHFTLIGYIGCCTFLFVIFFIRGLLDKKMTKRDSIWFGVFSIVFINILFVVISYLLTFLFYLFKHAIVLA